MTTGRDACVYMPQLRQVKRLLQVASVESFRHVTLVGCSGSRSSTSRPSRRAATAATALRHSLDLARHAERLGFTALLARRASQHARHRQRGDRRRHRARRRRHADHPRRRGRHHAAQPRAARRRRAVRHARIALSRAHRSRAGPRARAPTRQPRARCAARCQSDPDAFPQDVLELMAYFAAGRTDRRFSAVPGRGLARADLDPRLEPVRRAGRRRARPAIRVRVALRARGDDAGARDLPRELPAVAALAQPYVMLGVNVVAADTDDEARFLGYVGPRRRSPTCARVCRRRCRRRAGSGRRRSCRSAACRSKRRRRSRWSDPPATVRDGIRALRRADAPRRIDRRLAHLRLRRACAVGTRSCRS